MQSLSLHNRYFNQGYLRRHDSIISIFDPELPFNLNSQKVFKDWNISTPFQHEKLISESLTVTDYTGINSTVIEIQNFLKTYLAKDLHGAYLHGSLATGEEITYSDFDGLLILKNEVFLDKTRIAEVAKKISMSYSLMLKMDPLQHHGWFILTQRELSNWPTNFFPPVLFQYSKSLIENSSPLTIYYQINHSQSKADLNRLLNSIEKKLMLPNLPRNLFQLKALLSEFMLIPTLYIQLKTNQGVFKKFSFELAAKDFNSSDWEIMNTISELRNSWPKNTSNLVINKPKLVSSAFKRQQKNCSLDAPDSLFVKLNVNLKTEMLNLVQQFKKKII